MVISEKMGNDIVNLAIEAGKIIMRYYRSDFQINTKHDDSPVTTADFEAHKFIIKELPLICPDIEIISEEDQERKQVLGNRYWLIDPLDGTKNLSKAKSISLLALD